MQQPGKLIKSLATMQARMATIQKELANTDYPGSSGGGLITASLRGDGELTKLVITPEAMSEGPEMLAELIQAAVSSAVKAKEADSKAKLKGVSAGLLPAGFNIPGLA